MNLSQHFTLEELTSSVMARNRGINNTPSPRIRASLEILAKTVLEPLRVAYGKPIKVSSGYRCMELNTAIGGSRRSQHMKGQAADISSLGDTPKENKQLFDIAVRLIRSGKIQVGQCIDEYDYNWVHISTPSSHRNQILHLK